MNMVDISVIVPVYNVEKYIEKCLNSILNQSFINFELICINDGSTDKSLMIIEQCLLKCDVDHKIISTQNLGLSNARNVGLKNASGRYIIFVDSDDWIEENMLAELYGNAMEHNSDIVCCGFSRINEDGIQITLEQINLPTVMEPKEAIIKSAPAAWNKMYKKSLFVDNNIYFPIGLWYEDLSTTTKLFMKSKKITAVNKSLVNYLQRSNSIIHTYNDKVKDIYEVLIDLKKFNKLQCSGMYTSEVEFLFIVHIIFAHLFRCSHLNRIILEDEIRLSYGVIVENFENWSENLYLRNKEGAMGFIMRLGTRLYKIKKYLLFLYLYRVYDYLTPIKKKW